MQVSSQGSLSQINALDLVAHFDQNNVIGRSASASLHIPRNLVLPLGRSYLYRQASSNAEETNNVIIVDYQIILYEGARSSALC